MVQALKHLLLANKNVYTKIQSPSLSPWGKFIIAVTLNAYTSYTIMLSNTFRQVVKQSSIARRHYSTAPQAFQVFDRKVKCMQKDRAASNVEESRTVDYLKDEIAARVADRLLVKSNLKQTRKN